MARLAESAYPYARCREALDDELGVAKEGGARELERLYELDAPLRVDPATDVPRWLLEPLFDGVPRLALTLSRHRRSFWFLASELGTTEPASEPAPES